MEETDGVTRMLTASRWGRERERERETLERERERERGPRWKEGGKTFTYEEEEEEEGGRGGGGGAGPVRNFFRHHRGLSLFSSAVPNGGTPSFLHHKTPKQKWFPRH